MTLDQLPDLITVEEMAELLRTTPAGVYGRAARGKIPGKRKSGKSMLFYKPAIVAWLEKEPAK